MIILEDLDVTSNVSFALFEDSLYFATQNQAQGTCALAISLNSIGLLMSWLICFIMIRKNLSSDQLFVFLLCYFAAEMMHAIAYMFSIITSCYISEIILETICTLVEMILHLSGLLSFIWLSLNALIQFVYFAHPFKYMRACTMRNCLITILTISVVMSVLVFSMGGYVLRRPTFTSDCKRNEIKYHYYYIIILLGIFVASIMIQSYCPYRLWRLIKSQIKTQNELCMPFNVTHMMQINKQKTVRMLLVISGGFWIFHIPMVLIDMVTVAYIRMNIKDDAQYLHQYSVLYSAWPYINSVSKIVLHTSRPIVASVCTIITVKPMKCALNEWISKFMNH